MLPEGNVFLWEESGKSKQAKWLQLFCSGSQSECGLPHLSHSENQPNKGHGFGGDNDQRSKHFCSHAVLGISFT